jgi:outer membrane protein OmpA-like peptidoglycan-associated protein
MISLLGWGSNLCPPGLQESHQSSHPIWGLGGSIALLAHTRPLPFPVKYLYPFTKPTTSMRSTLMILLLGIGIHLSAQQHKTYTLYFDFNEHQLTAQAEQVLQNLLTQVQELDEYTIQIEAHTDDQGTQSYNRQLARKRANAVQAFLEGQGLAVESSNVMNFGEDRPAYSNDEEMGRQLNRRVDVIVTTVPLESLDDLMAKLRGDSRQSFTIDPNESTELTADNGTTLWIPAAAFQLEDGSLPDGPIDIIIEEHYNKSGMVANELSTHSGDRMLETGGMIYVGAESEGQPLDLREGAALTLGMPTAAQQDGMQLFDAQTNASGRPVDWVPTGQEFAKSEQEALLIPTRPKYPLYYKWRTPVRRNWKAAPQKPAPISVATYRAPKKPVLENVQYNPPFLKKLFMGKKKIAEKKQEIYDAQMARYQKNMMNYEKRLVAYENAKVEHQKKMVAYRWAYDTWEGAAVEDSLEFTQMHNQLEAEFRDRVQEKYKLRLAEWQNTRDSIMTAYYDAQMDNGELTMDGLSYYFYKIESPGWINCDRFYDVPQEEKMALAVRGTDYEEEKVFVVFKDINSMMRLYSKQGDRYVQNNLPKDAEVKIIALKVDNGLPSMAVLDTRVGEEPVINLKYEACKIKDIKAVLANI